MADTSNFLWSKPTVGGDGGAWGTKLNTLFDAIDTDLNTVKTTADAALPKAGGTMTGRVKQFTESYTTVSLGSSLSGATAVDLSLGNFFYGTATGNITLSFTNPPASGDACFFVIEITTATNVTITWPATATLADNVESAITSGVWCFAIYTRDGGTKYRVTMPFGGVSA